MGGVKKTAAPFHIPASPSPMEHRHNITSAGCQTWLFEIFMKIKQRVIIKLCSYSIRIIETTPTFLILVVYLSQKDIYTEMEMKNGF